MSDFDIDITHKPSPNYNSDKMIIPCIIVIHWTASYFQPAVDWLCNPKAQVSAHFVIDADGKKIYQLVDMNRRAWHCNPSWHPMFGDQKLDGLNSYSVGIECEGPPSSIKRTEWSNAFIYSLANLCKYIASRNPTICGITDHSTIAPKQKTDVIMGMGVNLFPWHYFIERAGLPDLATDDIRRQVKKHYGMV